jgi:apolipoprotein N-acyltransferase
MLITVTLLLALAALIITIVHAMNRCPLWPAVLVLTVIELLRSIPLGR